MANLLESTVQNSAQAFLAKRYGGLIGRRKLFSKTEVRTKQKYGGKRADGLLAYKHWLFGTYVVSMEAKSYKTLPAMKPKFDAWFFLKNCFQAGFVICIVSGAFFALYKTDDALLQIIIPMNAFLVGTLLYGILTFTNYSNKIVSVVKQVSQYPANEQWLAFRHLLKICKARGIGILEVKAKGKVKIKIKPKMKSNFGKGFLHFYSKEKEIRGLIH
jgi:hypothetical protein